MRSNLEHCLGVAAGFAMVVTAGCGTGQTPPEGRGPQDRLLPHDHRDGFSGGAFLHADLQLVSDALPEGFALLDGAEIGASFEGRALLGIAAWPGLRPSSSQRYSFALIVLLVEPPVDAEQFDSVRLNWYEHARIVDDDELYCSWQSAGLEVVRGRFRYDPFLPAGSVAQFSCLLSRDPVFETRTDLNRSVHFPGQTLAFWQVSSERLYYSLFRFEPHNSWLGGLSACVFEFDRVLNAPLADFGCPDQGLTEVIEHINFTSSVGEWGEPVRE